MGVRLSFPPFTFDRDERVLRRDGRTVPLAPKVAEALGLLLAEPGALVEKNALRDALWPDGFVEDGNLTQTIYLIRRALDPDGDGRTFVETIPRRGYRFVPPVSVVEPDRPSALARFAFAARAVAAGLAIVVLSGGVSIGSSGASPSALTGDAGRAYAVGRYNWNRRTENGVRMAIANFERVVQLAPNDARGYAGLADAYMTTGQWEYTAIAPKPVAYRRAESYARRALERDPRSGEALTTLSWLMLDKNNDLDATERMLRTGIALNPNHAPAYEYLGIALLYDADADGARTALRRSVELDPLSPIDLLWYGRALYYSRRFGEARVAFRQVMDLDGRFADAPVMLALADAELGKRDEAMQAIASARFPPEKRDYVASTVAFVDVRMGRAPRALPDLRPRKGVHIDAATAAALCLAFGRRDDALAWVKLSFEDPHERISRKMITLDPRLAPLKDDPRFRAITG